MIEHRSPISGIASFSDRYISTAGYDNQVILWDAKNKRALGKGTHDHLVNQCRFSHDGRYLVTSSSDCTARIWAVPSMRLTSVLSGHHDDVESIAINDDNNIIATCSRDHCIRLFNKEGGLIKILKGHTQDVISIEWLESSHILISSSDDGTVKRWDTKTGEILNDIDLGGAETDTIVITKKGVIFAANDDGNIISIVTNPNSIGSSINAGDLIQQEFSAHKAGIKRLVYSKESNSIVSLSYDRTVKIWSIVDNTSIVMQKTTDIPGIIWPRSCCFIGIDQLAFATFGSCYATLDCNTLTWDLSSINPTIGINAVLDTQDNAFSIGDAGIIQKHNAQQHPTAIRTLPSLCNFLLEVGDHIVTGGQSGEIFNALTGDKIYQHHSPLNCGTTYQIEDTTYAAIGTYTGEIVILKMNDLGRLSYDQTTLLQDNAIKGICNDGNTLFSVSATGQAAFHDIRTLNVHAIIPKGHDKISNGCATLGDHYFASVSRDLKLRIWNSNESNHSIEASQHDTPLTFSIKCITAIPTASMIAIGSYGGEIALFDYQKTRWVSIMRPTTAGISNLTVSADQSKFIASSYDGKLHYITLSQYR